MTAFLTKRARLHSRQERRTGIVVLVFIFLVVSSAGAQETDAASDLALLERARRLAAEILLVDTHIDLPSKLLRRDEDVATRTGSGEFDYVRAREGGLDVAFMSIYIPSDFEGSDKAERRASAQIDLVDSLTRRWPDKFELVTSARQVRERSGRGKILLAMGMENGAPIRGRLKNLRRWYNRGIRYITLAHAKANHISDASYDPHRKWNGLSPFGRTVVREMNRLGIMVDVSHLTDSACTQVLRISKAPVIASHSSCRFFTPGFERNMDDAMIRRLAAAGGVIQISFGSAFISNAYRMAEEERGKEIDRHVQINHLTPGGSKAREYTRQYKREHPLKPPTVRDVAAHVDHVVKLVGVDYVGMGSDFEGVGGALPVGLQDVSEYPRLIAEFLALGYSEEDIRKICGGNLLRVWQDVERIARESGGE